jgi:hypothetical protein
VELEDTDITVNGKSLSKEQWKDVEWMLSCFDDVYYGGDPELFAEPFRTTMKYIIESGCPKEKLLSWGIAEGLKLNQNK